MIRISLGVDDYYIITWYIILSDTKTYYDFNRGAHNSMGNCFGPLLIQMILQV